MIDPRSVALLEHVAHELRDEFRRETVGNGQDVELSRRLAMQHGTHECEGLALLLDHP